MKCLRKGSQVIRVTDEIAAKMVKKTEGHVRKWEYVPKKVWKEFKENLAYHFRNSGGE